jgi:hypothetical protein|tara:strand:- start:551 stop:739 length:189 start_codon:yes stop_codon:yes gene_type:complete
MISTTTAFLITMGACIVTYYWGKTQNDTAEIAHEILDSLRDGGYIKTKTDENGEEEIIKLDD